jgi:hypothetical protein
MPGRKDEEQSQNLAACRSLRQDVTGFAEYNIRLSLPLSDVALRTHLTVEDEYRI